MRKMLSLVMVFVFIFVQLPFTTPFPVNAIQPDPTHSVGLSSHALSQDYSPDDLAALPPVTSFDYEFAAPSPRWQALATGDAPASFTQVEYELAEDVLDITGQNTVIESIASEGQLLAGSTIQKIRPLDIIEEGGYVPRVLLDAAAAEQGRTVDIGTVVVDTASRTAFKIASPTVHTGMYQANQTLQNMVSPLQDMYSITRPQLQEIVKDFSLGGTRGETIELTRGNISGFAPNIEKNLVLGNPASVQPMSLRDQYQGYENIYGDLMVNLQFDEELLDAQLSDGAHVRVKVSGGIGIQRIMVNAKYTSFSGYRFALTLNQESYLVVEMEAVIYEEIRIPVIGINADIGDVGRVTGGVFVIVGIDGSLRLEIAAREFTSTTVGVRGGTAAYIPTSIRPVYNHTMKGDGDVNLTGKVNGYIKFGPMLGVELFGYDLVGAGVFLGTGVQVEADPQHLDIELYGILNVYVDFLGKHFNLLNLQPTIWERKQTDTAGHQVTFMEAYVYPGRVSGIIRKEVPISSVNEDGFTPVPNMPYRIWIIPKDMTFDPGNPGHLSSADISKYPSAGYARTNAEGVFFQKDDDILEGGEQAVIEFQVNGKSYFSNPAQATLPFEKYTITQGDYFNDFVVGQVQPIRVINWDVPVTDTENRYDIYYYANSPVQVRPFLYVTISGHDKWLTNGGVAYARTDAYGNFDTRDVYVSDEGEEVPHWNFDVRPDPESWIFFNSFRFAVILDYNGATISGEVPYSSTMNMAFSRLVKEVPNSYKRFDVGGGRLVDQMAYDEYIYVANPNGTLAVSEEEFCYWAQSFSTQDFHTGLIDYRYVPLSIANELWRKGAPDSKTPKKNLLPVLDANGEPTGSTLFFQRVFVEWVWQAHPNPVTITSEAQFSAPASGGSFQVTATGYAPFTFSLTDAPEGVEIDQNTGLITIAEGIVPAEAYQFTVRVEENREKYQVTMPNGLVVDQSKLLGPYEGNDPSPPDEQLFTLTVSEDAEPTDPELTPTPSVTPEATPTPEPTPEPTPSASPEATPTPAPTPTPSPTPSPTPTPRTAPVIQEAEHNYEFILFIGTEDRVEPIFATGSQPIFWLVEQTFGDRLPEEISINRTTGELTIGKDIAEGEYYFTIIASNDVGTDTRDCTLFAGSLGTDQVSYHSNEATAPNDPDAQILLLSSSPVSAKDFLADTPSIDQEFFSSDEQFAFDPSDLQLKPPNILTLRYDDPNDVYTDDRWTKNGAEFVRWQSFPGVLQRFNHMTDHYWNDGTGTMLLDASPRSDNYHYQAPAASPVSIDDIMQFYQERISDYQNQEIFLGERFNQGDLLETYFTNRSRPSSATFLDYGTIIARLNEKQDDQHEVALDQYTGTLVSGKIFTALQDYKKARLTFRQEGAVITFIGQDITSAADHEVYDFAYQEGAVHEADMAEQLEAGEQHFICSFAEYPMFPGLATFSITTDISQDTAVNVYQYEAADGKFSLIAEAVVVGENGIVTYRNRTMSELLITTQTLKGAAVSEAAAQQLIAQEQSGNWIIPAALALLLVLILAAGAFIGWKQLKKKRAA